jgi:CRISPR-associated protein Cmr1
MNDPTREWRLKALTDLWTGSVRLQQADKQLQERIIPDRLVTTGLLGSTRWWTEVLVRGLGGAACDPSDDANRCPDQQGRRCVVCELFGCTGWARKFRFEVRDGKGAVMSDQIKKGTEFVLRFTPLRPIAAEEWALLDLTIRLITDYGALGGKTVLKPSDEAARRGLPHHRDYGIVNVEQRPSIEPRSRSDLERYVRNSRWRKPPQQDFAWASLTNFWCVNGKYLARQSANQSTFSKVVGRKEPKSQGQQPASNDRADRWLAGRQQESKKVFSFREQPRTFGFVNPGVVTLDQMKQRLTQGWGTLGPNDFVTGDAILAHLTTHGGAAS